MIRCSGLSSLVGGVMRPPLVVAVVTLVAAISSQTQAQQLQGVPRLDPQSRVRVWATSPVMTDQHATVIGVSADTLHLFIGEQMEGIPLAAVTRLEVRTRARGGHGWTGLDRKSTRLNSSHP